MQVLLTGATGFVGSFAVPALLAAGHEVVALVRDPAKAASVSKKRADAVRKLAVVEKAWLAATEAYEAENV